MSYGLICAYQDTKKIFSIALLVHSIFNETSHDVITPKRDQIERIIQIQASA